MTESVPTEQEAEFQRALRDQQAAVLESVQVSYTELMSASSRGERDRLLLYSLVGLAIGVGNSAAVSLIPQSVPYWVLSLGFALTLLFFCTTYFISLRADQRRLTTARDLKVFYVRERSKEVMQVIAQGIDDPKELEPGWLAAQDLMGQSRTNDLLTLQENSSDMDGYALKAVQDHIYFKYEQKGLKEISSEHRALIVGRASQKQLAALAENYADAVLISPTAHLRASRIISYFPILLALTCVVFLVGCLLMRVLQKS